MAARDGRFQKSVGLYAAIVSLWAVLFGCAAWGLWMSNAVLRSQSAVGALLLVVVVAFVGYFWLNGVKDLLYLAWYYLVMPRRAGGRRRDLPPAAKRSAEPRVVLVYCTRNDFNASALERSMGQDYGNLGTVILDDSDDTLFIQQIDEWALRHDVQVVRRQGRAGYKAGNLNNYLRGGTYDFAVILDSDEVIPADFTSRALDYFAADRRVGIVQANHVAAGVKTAFQSAFSLGVDSHWPVYQSVKSSYGFMSLLGHGAMISQACYDAAGGFPHVVAEDISFSLAAREAGFLTVFAPDITCEEEYPPDYLAFRKRHAKWTEGNMEFIRRSTLGIASSRRLRWFEKLDVVLFTYALPLTAVFSSFILINIAVLPLMGQRIVFPLWTLVPTLSFLFAPMLNDVIYHWRTESRGRLAVYSGGAMLLYGGMYWTSLRASVRSTFGGSVFTVTPRHASSLSFRNSLRAVRGEVLFAGGLLAVSAAFMRSVWPVLLLVLPAFAAVFLAVLHQSPGGAHRERVGPG